MLDDTPSRRFPVAESVLDGASLQSHVHDCLVFVDDGQHSFSYDVFYKRHKFLPINSSIPDVDDADRMRGDVLVMRRGRTGDGVVNMRERDTVIADLFMSRLVLCFSAFRILLIPVV
jgi:hypothetical protein